MISLMLRCCLFAVFAPLVWSAPINYVVPGPVVPLKQVGNTCWATTATMLKQWQKQQSLAVPEVAAMAGPQFSAMYSAGMALPRDQKAEFLSGLGFQALAPACYLPDAFLSLLKQHGALWITIDSTLVAMTHAVIVRGLVGDGTTHGSNVLYVDPATGTDKTLPFDVFQKKFENAAGLSDIQIVRVK